MERERLRFLDSSSSSSSGELFPIEDSRNIYEAFEYSDPRSYSGIIRAVIDNDLEKVKKLVEQGGNVRSNDNHGNTALHVAVAMSTEENVDIIKYLLTVKNVEVNDWNYYGHTPLLISCMQSKETAALLLIEAGAETTISSNEYFSPLHYSVRYSTKVSQALIQAGADIDYVDYNGDTPMHDAVSYGDIEVLCMLLYYGADANVTNSGNLTPFMQCLATDKFEQADQLFEYVIDFNQATKEEMSTLFLAITSRYPRILDIIERGADVNYSSENDIYNAFSIGVLPPLDVFEYMWNRFDYKNVWGSYWPNILVFIMNDLGTTGDYKVEAIRILLENDNLKKTEQLTSDSEKYPILHPLVNKLYKVGTPVETVHKLCAILLSCNLKVYNTDLDMVYERYGYCDLFKLLLHMDIESAGVKKFNFFPSLIYTVKPNNDFYGRMFTSFLELTSMTSHNLHCIDFDNIFDYLSYPQMKRIVRENLQFNNDPDAQTLLHYINAFPEVPKLLELASNTTRDVLCRTYKVTNSRQFYTILNQLEIPHRLKKCIALAEPLYTRCLMQQLFKFRQRMKQVRETNILLLDEVFYQAVPFSTEYPEEVRA